MIGKTVGPYQVVARLGEGGMGEVYRAHDTKLGRDVALKVLPDAFAHDPERLARFKREAQVLASLNHPNIAHIHGLEEADGTQALVMELVEGPTLADRVAQEAIPVDEALLIAKQIAEALEAAHEQGIVHRDLKPANIKVRDDGTVKVLDFGLAKALDPAQGSGLTAQGGISHSPTITSPAMTQMGMILGTAAYMSPEQARGRHVDKRADIWAFGCVLFEMLTGTRAFEGSDTSEVFAAVIKSEPNWKALPGLSPLLESYLRQCLKKDPKQRIHDIGDVRLALEGAFETSAPQAPPEAAARRWWRLGLPFGTALAGAGLAAWILWPVAQPATVGRFSYYLPQSQTFRSTGRTVIALSPDGRSFVYNAAGGLYLRNMDSLEARVIAGTEEPLANPFFSPDGQAVGYFQSGELRRIHITGGSPTTIAGGIVNPFGASWASDETIVFAQPAGIMRVPVSGGTPALVIPIKENERMSGPHLLPGGDLVLFTVTTGVWASSQLVAESLSTHARTVIASGAVDARYVLSGYVIYASTGGLFARTFDPDRRAVGEPVSVEPDVSTEDLIASPTVNYDVSIDGTLVFLSASPAADFSPKRLTWIDRAGRTLDTVGGPAPILNFDLAPDDSRVVDERVVGGRRSLWMTDLRRANLSSPLVGSDFRSPGFISDPVFSRRGDRVAFASGDGSVPPGRHTVDRIYAVPSDGGDPTVLFEDAKTGAGWLEDWGPDGTHLALNRVEGVVVSLRDRSAVVFDDGVLNLDEARFSPDGKWIAYHANRAQGGIAVFVVPFPPTGQRFPISGAGGGSQARWRQDGHELFYLAPDGALMSVDVRTEPTFAAGTPRRLFNAGIQVTPIRDQYAVSRDGQRFLVAAPADTSGERPHVVIVQNWLDVLKRLVPAN